MSIAICSIAWCQEGKPAPSLAKATLPDMSITCDIHPESRDVEVHLVNKSSKRVWFQSVMDVDARSNYDVVATGAEGKRLPKPQRPKPKSYGGENGKPLVTPLRRTEGFVMQLDPGQQIVERFPLSAMVEMPAQGGKFKIRIGRALFLKLETDEFDPAEILWCKPMNVILPPLK